MGKDGRDDPRAELERDERERLPFIALKMPRVEATRPLLLCEVAALRYVA